MGFAEKRDTYWRGRYKLGPGKYGTVKDSSGATVRFRTKREAEQAANDAEVKVRTGVRFEASTQTFGTYANEWYERLDLAASTMQNYRRRLEEHLLPAFEGRALAEISRADILAWVRAEREAGYQDSSIRSWRALLHLVLADAVEDGLIPANPAANRRGRGRRVGRAQHRAAEKTITDALGGAQPSGVGF
jgi:hypothetical protein